MANTADIKNGLVIEHKNDLYRVVEFQHVKPGKGGAFVRTKLKNLRTGRVIDETWNSGEKIQDVKLEPHSMQFLYASGDDYHFMNTESYEQMHLTKDFIGDGTDYLVPEMKVQVEFHEGKPISVELPATVDLKVIETEPGLRTGSVSNVGKPAKLESGLTVSVPQFVNEGDVIRVNTSEGT